MSSSRETPRLVAMSIDDRYLWPWACAAYSAVRNAKMPVRFLLANANGLLSSRAQAVARDFLSFLGVEGEIVDISLTIGEVDKYQWNVTSYARLGLLDTLNERFLWLDSDTILCGDWTQIFAAAEDLMQDSHIIACGVSDRSATLDWLRKEGTNTAFRAAKEAYINAGIIVFDPLRWRHGGMDRTWVDLVSTQSERGFEFLDQDVLNYLLAGKVGLLPARFNHIVSEATNGSESILHFAGSPKPWRLTESGRALFIATEAATSDQAKDPMWGSGQAWELFPKYWEVERAVITSLQENNRTELASSLLRHRDAQLMQLPKLQRMKFWGIRLLSKQIFPSKVRR